MTPAVLTRPYVGLWPTIPQHCAGCRMEQPGIRSKRRVGHSGGDGHRRPAAGSAGMEIRAPGIGDGAEKRIHRRRTKGQLVQSRLSQTYGARHPQTGDRGRICARDMFGVVPGAVGRPHTRGVDEVLDRHGNAVQWTAIGSVGQFPGRPARLAPWPDRP